MSVRNSIYLVSHLLSSATLNAIFIPLTRLVARDPNRWLFVHQGGLFAGNSKYLFLWMSIYREDVSVVWIAEDKSTQTLLLQNDLKCLRRRSLQGMIAALRSSKYFYCHTLADISIPLSGGAFLCNLWHGVGIKSLNIREYEVKYGSNPLKRTAFYEYIKKPDLIATTSDFTQAHFSQEFNIPLERCPQLGYPRLDTLTDTVLLEKAIRIDLSQGFEFNRWGFKEVYIYMPTWRDTKRAFLTDALPDLDALAKSLQSRGAILYVKLHPWTADEWPGDLDNIKLWPNSIEVYSYINHINALITDYSSILYDFLLAKSSGIVLYMFDYKRYTVEDRVLIYPFGENTAGHRVYTFDDLRRVIEDGTVTDFCPEAAHIRQKFWRECKTSACQRIFDYLHSSAVKD